MNEEVAAALRAGVMKISADVSEKFRGLIEKEGELQARLSEVEKNMARPRGDAVGSFGGGYQSALGKAADDVLAGLRDATSTRLNLPAMTLKLMAAAITSTTYAPPGENLGAVSTYHPLVARLIDLLPSRPVTGNSLVYTRIAYATDSPGGNAAAKVAETVSKPASSVVTTPVEVQIPTFAHWADASKQIVDDVVELKAILDSLLRDGLLDIVDADIYATLTTVGNFTTFTPTATETIGDGVARIAGQIANQGGAGIIVALNPLDFLTMQLAKASTSGAYLGMPPNLASRVVSVAAVAQSKILAFAPTSGASWADRQGVTVVAGLKSDDFIKNMVTLLCESRGATLVRDPAHVAYGNTVA